MGEVRIKTSPQTDRLVKSASEKLGLTQAELCRVALMNFLKDMRIEVKPAVKSEQKGEGE